MNSRRFVLVSMLFLYGTAFGIAGICYCIDLHGMFGDVSGKEYKPAGNERAGKYLLAHNYIPSNFDAVLCGSSTSVNWDVGAISGYTAYNLSLNGGNISEERLLLETVLKKRKPRLAVLVVTPYLLKSTGMKTREMDPRQYWGALGSLQFLKSAANTVGVNCGWIKDVEDSRGRYDFTLKSGHHNVENIMDLAVRRQLPECLRGEAEFGIAAGSTDELLTIVRLCQQAGSRVVVVYPPYYRKQFDFLEPELRKFQELLQDLFPEPTAILDFNTPRYDAIRSNLANYHDHNHFSRSGAELIVRELNQFLYTSEEGTRLLTNSASSDDNETSVHR